MAKTCPVCESVINDAGGKCPFCGFNLTEVTQQFSPIVVHENPECDVSALPPKTASLQVFKGPQVGQVFQLGTGEASVGRDPKNDVFLNDMTVSRAHATIKPQGTTYQINDTNSFNGVWVNGNNVTSTLLKNGDVIQIGAFGLVFNQQ